MNTGMPNATKLVTKLFLSAYGVTGILGWVIQQIIVYFGVKGEQKLLAYMDNGQVIIVVNSEMKNFDQSNSQGWSLVHNGQVLTKDEANAINQPVIDALVEFGAFNKLHKPS